MRSILRDLRWKSNSTAWRVHGVYYRKNCENIICRALFQVVLYCTIKLEHGICWSHTYYTDDIITRYPSSQVYDLVSDWRVIWCNSHMVMHLSHLLSQFTIQSKKINGCYKRDNVHITDKNYINCLTVFSINVTDLVLSKPFNQSWYYELCC